ncbi:CLUMA_CG016653, isoform A [Clunio marinus]|uniref:CLUMA_CG016653, isoform A n=1 Tax=Clunio marinus TaxID=568069 RepID=A0A1J1ISX1_9DIPT|nr:CLUMA_CG016653, isoform A [Clunio marinus]
MCSCIQSQLFPNFSEWFSYVCTFTDSIDMSIGNVAFWHNSLSYPEHDTSSNLRHVFLDPYVHFKYSLVDQISFVFHKQKCLIIAVVCFLLFPYMNFHKLSFNYVCECFRTWEFATKEPNDSQAHECVCLGLKN